jgi:predicted RNase H-like nuclease (RuvC/YqgF family)
LKERDEPNRLGKANENLKKAVEHLRSDLEKLQSTTKTLEIEYDGEVKVKKEQEETKEKLNTEISEKEAKIKELDKDNKRLKDLSTTIDKEILNIT